MAKPKKDKTLLHKYLIVNLSTFLKHPHLQTITFKDNRPLLKQVEKLLHNSYAVSEKHPNISMIAVIAAEGGAYWQNLHGEHQLVRPLI